MTAPNDLDAEVLDVLETHGLTAREAATRLTDKNCNGTIHADGPGEFWCGFCGRRCTRNSSDGTEYGHDIDCPERELPDPRDHEGHQSSGFTPNLGEHANRGTATLDRALDALDD